MPFHGVLPRLLLLLALGALLVSIVLYHQGEDPRYEVAIETIKQVSDAVFRAHASRKFKEPRECGLIAGAMGGLDAGEGDTAGLDPA